MFAAASQTTRIRGNLTRSSRDASFARQFAGISLIMTSAGLPDGGFGCFGCGMIQLCLKSLAARNGLVGDKFPALLSKRPSNARA
jgi:hypothetical protein